MPLHHEFERDDVFPSWFANAIQQIISAACTDLHLSRASSTSMQVVPRPPAGVAGIVIEGKWRYVSETITRSHPGGSAGTYDVWAVATDNEITSDPDPYTDETDYDFELRITATGNDPSGTGVEIFEKIGELEWNGSAITSWKQTAFSVPTEWLQDGAVTGPKIAPGAVGPTEQGHPAALATRDSNQSIPADAWTAMSWSDEVTDTGGCWSAGSPTRLTAPVDGLYLVSGNVQIAGSTSGIRVLGIRRNGSDLDFISDTVQQGMGNMPGNTVGNALAISEHVALEAGDYVELCVYQNSGAARNVVSDFAHHPYFGMSWAGALSS